jgi:outer membrane autotransporter protein
VIPPELTNNLIWLGGYSMKFLNRTQFSLCVLVSHGLMSLALAQSAVWDSTISNTSWYVPVPQLLAYMSQRSGFTNPLPIGDQTLWTLGTSINGVFSGTSNATLNVDSKLSLSTTIMQGTVTTAGKITIFFTPAGGGTTTVGVGQMQSRGGSSQMEMQMITGTDLLTTHWAYMLPYNLATFTPPAAQAIPLSISAPNWSWTQGTPWKLVSPTTFGVSTPASFIISNYKNGYFWGQGVGPAGSSVSSFTLLGSTTPEGKVLFNTLSNGTLTSLYGDLSGSALNAQMLMAAYGATGAGDQLVAVADLIHPYSEAVTAVNNPSALGAAKALYSIAGTTNGLFGAMSPAISTLNNLNGQALSNAISQTVPVLVGAASQATYNTQRAFQQTVLTRLDNIRGMASGNAFESDGNAWVKPFGSMASQSGLNDVAGYRTSGGGIAVGLDRTVTPDLTVGGVFAYSYNAITGSADATTNNLGVNSYQLGLYGAYALAPSTDVNFQVDVGLNQNNENRSIGFMNTGASARYSSTTGHVGLGLQHLMPVSQAFSLIPSVRLDYANITADSYTESGAGALSLNVNGQTYQELMLTAGLKGDYQVSDRLKLTANAGVGYNTLNNQTQITASYAGGGENFVTYGMNVSPWLYSAGLGLVQFEKNGMELAVRYDVQASPTGFVNQMASVRFRMSF